MKYPAQFRRALEWFDSQYPELPDTAICFAEDYHYNYWNWRDVFAGDKNIIPEPSPESFYNMSKYAK